MLHAVMVEAKDKKYVILVISLFFFFWGLYTFLDFEGSTNYSVMISNFGVPITIIHIFINVIIAFLTSIMVSFSIINYNLYRVEPKGSNAVPFLTFIFGLLTFGCTGCVVAFFTSVGIAFTPIILPNANLLWKLAALLFVVLGFAWIMYSIQHTKCKVDLKE